MDFWYRLALPQVKDLISKDIQAITGHSVKAVIDKMTRIQVSRVTGSLLRDWAHPTPICFLIGLAAATSASGLGSPLPHLRRDCAQPCHIHAGTGLAPIQAGPGSPRECNASDVGERPRGRGLSPAGLFRSTRGSRGRRYRRRPCRLMRWRARLRTTCAR